MVWFPLVATKPIILCLGHARGSVPRTMLEATYSQTFHLQLADGIARLFNPERFWWPMHLLKLVRSLHGVDRKTGRSESFTETASRGDRRKQDNC